MSTIPSTSFSSFLSNSLSWSSSFPPDFGEAILELENSEEMKEALLQGKDLGTFTKKVGNDLKKELNFTIQDCNSFLFFFSFSLLQ